MTVRFNQSDVLEIEDCDIDDLVDAAYHELVSVNNVERRRLGRKPDEARLLQIRSRTAFLIDANVEGLVRLPINSFGRVNENLTSTSVDLIVVSSPLAVSLKGMLAEHGVPSAILQHLTPRTQPDYKAEFNRVLAGFAMSVTGAKDWGALGVGTILKLLQAYACDNTRSFRRKDLWGSRFDIAGRFLREIARVLGEVMSSREIAAFQHADRSSSTLPVQNPPAHLSAWTELYEEWRRSVKAISKSPILAMGRLLAWLDEEFSEEETVDPKKFLTTKRERKFIDFVMGLRKREGRDTYSSSTQVELGAMLRFSEFAAEYSGLIDAGMPVFHLLTHADVDAYGVGVHKSGKLNNSGEGTSLPLPPILYALFQELLLEGEGGWPGKQEVCKFFAEGETRYCPILPSIFLLAFELPGRFVQLTSLDSGEGDNDRFDGSMLRWTKNDSPHARYWTRQGIKIPRGYARKTRNLNITGFFFNINKTGTPFVVPWQNAAAHRICDDVRRFVEKWVPITGPVSPQEFRQDLVRSDEQYLDKLPSIFPLFRMPSVRSQRYGQPISSRIRRDFWLDAMLEVQNRYNATVPPEAALDFVTVDGSGKPVKCIYTPHGMRSAGITKLLREGVSITVVSKLLVGHAGILMTQRYNKPDPADIHDVLEGNRLAREPRRGNLSESLHRMSFEEASRRTVSGSEEVLKIAYHGARSTWVERDVGLCPWMGQRCGDGGECVRRDVRNGVDKSLYKSLEDGNCLVCRHLITDPNYIDGIYAKLEVLSRRLAVLTRRYEKVSATLFEIEKRYSEDDITLDQAPQLDRERKKLQVDLNDVVQAQNGICESIAHGQRYIEQLRLIEKFEDLSDPTERRLIHPDNALSEWDESAEHDEWVFLSDFEHLTRIMHKSTFFTSVHDAEAEASFRLMVDNFTIEAGYRPISLNRRTPQEQQEDYLRAARLVLNKINRQELMAMQEENLTPRDLGFDDFFQDLKLERLSAPVGTLRVLPLNSVGSLAGA